MAPNQYTEIIYDERKNIKLAVGPAFAHWWGCAWWAHWASKGVKLGPLVLVKYEGYNRWQVKNWKLL